MTNFIRLRNARTTYYEIHVEGCTHQIAKHMELMPGVDTFDTAVEAAEWNRDHNEGCAYTLGPCARKGSGTKPGQYWFIDC